MLRTTQLQLALGLPSKLSKSPERQDDGEMTNLDDKGTWTPGQQHLVFEIMPGLCKP